MKVRSSSVEYEREAFCLTDTVNDSPLQRFETFIQDPVGSTPMQKADLENDEILGNLTESVTENLTLRVSDEGRVTAALVDASKKRKTGSVFSVEVDLSGGEMGLGVKILKNNLLVISMLKRHNRILGPGEAAGLRLGDIIFGANFRPCVEGVRSLLHAVKYSLKLAAMTSKHGRSQEGGKGEEENSTKPGFILRPGITLQCWRCHQLCSDPIPGRLFPRADDVFVQGYSLYRSRVLSEWERWNFNEILLNFLKTELKIRLEDEVKMIATLGANPRIRVIHNEVLDLERNILKAKGLRTALCVRIVHTKFIDDAVLYVLRVEDEESGLQWNVRKRYNDFYALHKELSTLSKYLHDIPFPKKRIVHSRLSLRVIEERIVALEQFIRQAVHRLTQYSSSDAQASQSLRKVQEFLDVEMFINCLKPPPLDDQRYLELMTYRRLNDFASLSCQQCIRFVDSVDLDALAQNDKSNGYLPMLELVAQALREVEQYAIQQYGQQMNQILKDRRPHMPEDKVRSFVAKCVRRQVEGAIYLPLRRAIFRIVYSFIADKAERLQKSMKILKRAPMKIFFEKGNYDDLHLVKSLPLAVEAFRNLVNAFLPSDQGNMLMKAAGAVMAVISEMEAAKKGGLKEGGDSELPSSTPDEERDQSNALPEPPAAHKERHSFSFLNSPTKGLEMKSSRGISSNDGRRPQSLSNKKYNHLDTKASSSSNDLLSLKTLADPAGTIFSAAEHVLVDRRDFDRDGAQSDNVHNDEEVEQGEPSENSLSLIDDATRSNDSFRELYSILKTEGGRGDKNKHEVHKVMRDMAAATSNAKVTMTDDSDSESETEKTSQVGKEANNNESARSGSPCSESSSSDSMKVDDDDMAESTNPSPPVTLSRRDEVKDSDFDSDSDSDTDTRQKTASVVNAKSEQPLPLSSSITQTLLSSGGGGGCAGAVTAIRGTSMTRLEGLEGGAEQEGQPAFRPSEQRTETYMSPFKVKAEANVTARSSEGESTKVIADEGAGGQSAAPVAVGADDFLPMFTYVLVQSNLPQLLLVKELMVTLVDNEEMYGECGYYMATLEAATQHIVQMADEYSVNLSKAKILENKYVEQSSVTLPLPSRYSSSSSSFPHPNNTDI